MDIKAKSAVLLLIILMLVFLSAAGTGFYLYQQEHAKNIELEDKLDELSTKQKITEAKLLEAQKVLSSLEIKLKESADQVNNLTNALAQEKASKEEALANLEQIKSDLGEQKGARFDLENKLKQAQNEAMLMQSKLDAMDSEKKVLESKVKDLEASSQGVELGKIVVSPETAASNLKVKKAGSVKESKEVDSSDKKIEGTVLVVNKEYNFVVISLGSKDGVKLDQVFSIYRGNSHIADVKVEKLHDAMAAAGFLLEGTEDKVREGDKVVEKVK